MPLLNIPGFNMEYYSIKVIHIISASWIMGYLILNLMLSSSLPTKWLKFLDVIILIALLIQPITGFIIIVIKPYDPMTLWVIGAVLGYAMVCCLWFSLIFFQYRSIYLTETSKTLIAVPALHRLHLRYQTNRKILISLCLLILVVMYYFMINRP